MGTKQDNITDLASVLYETYSDFYLEYTKEENKNIHIKKFDRNHSIKSLLKTFVSDIITSQLSSKNSVGFKNPFFLPIEIELKGINEEGKVEALYFAYNQLSEKLEGKKYKKDDIEKLILEDNAFEPTQLKSEIEGKENLFQELSLYYKFVEDPDNADESFWCEYKINVRLTNKIELSQVSGIKNALNYYIKNIFLIGIFTRRLKKYVDDEENSTKRWAVAAVMARNMSHNIGAHVDYRTTLPKIKERLRELYNIFISCETCLGKGTEKLVYQWIDTMKERLDEEKTQRNEFLADYRPPPKNTMFYHDVLLPFAENTLLMDNIAASEGIVYSPNGVHNRLYIKSFINNFEIQAIYPLLQELKLNNNDDKNGNNVAINYPYQFPYLLRATKEGIDLNQAFNNKKLIYSDKHGEQLEDVEIVLPSEQSFHSILENFIRNSAKHNKHKLEDTNSDLIIHISINDNDNNPGYYDVTLYDNVSAVTATTLLNLQQKIEASLLDDNGIPRRENLGIADMKINAHLLVSQEEITDDLLRMALSIVVFDKVPDLDGCLNCNFLPLSFTENERREEAKLKERLESILTHVAPESRGININGEAEIKYHFGYRFKLAKTKKVCWIGKKIANDDQVRLEKRGIYLFEDFEQYVKKMTTSMAAFQFAVIESKVLQNWNAELNKVVKDETILNEFEKKLLLLPFRILLNIEKAEIIKGRLNEFVENRRFHVVESTILCNMKEKYFDYIILKSCWENWLNRWLKTAEGEKRPHLIVYFEDQNAKWGNFNGNKYFRFTHLFGAINSKIDEDSNEKYIIYDQHGEGLKRVPSVYFKDHFYQIIGKNSSDFPLIFSPPIRSEEKELLCYEMIEAGLCSFLILDERLGGNIFHGQNQNHEISKVQHGLIYGSSQVNQKPSFQWHIAATGRLFFVKKYLDKLFLKDMDKNENKFVCTLTKEDEDNLQLTIKYGNELIINSPDCIIMHRTFLNEEWLREKFHGKTIEEKQNQFFRLIQKLVPFIIVISGGGAPHGVCGYYKYKPFSMYDSLFGYQFSKLRITKYSLS